MLRSGLDRTEDRDEALLVDNRLRGAGASVGKTIVDRTEIFAIVIMRWSVDAAWIKVLA